MIEETQLLTRNIETNPSTKFLHTWEGNKNIGFRMWNPVSFSHMVPSRSNDDGNKVSFNRLEGSGGSMS